MSHKDDTNSLPSSTKNQRNLVRTKALVQRLYGILEIEQYMIIANPKR